jgi:hypothetical protein
MAKSYGGVLGHPSGKVGNVVFYTYRGRACMRGIPRKIGKKKFAKDPRFINTRKNAAEFGRAGKAVKLIHHVLQCNGFTSAYKSSRWRMQSLMMDVIKADRCNEWGMRNVDDGDLTHLEGFNFLETPAPVSIASEVVKYDHRTGALGIVVEIPRYLDLNSGGLAAGNCKVSVLAMSIDFCTAKFVAVKLDEGTSDLSNGYSCKVNFNGKLKTSEDVPLLIVMRIQARGEDNIPVGSSRYDVLELSNVVWPNSKSEDRRRKSEDYL